MRKPAHPETVYSPALLRALMVISLLAGGLFYFLTRNDPMPSGALIVRAWSWSMALALVVIAFFARKDETGRLWRRLTLVLAIGFVATMTIGTAAAIVIMRFKISSAVLLPGYAVMVAWPVWTFLAARQAFRDENATTAPGLRAVNFCVIGCVAMFAIPFAGLCEDARRAPPRERETPLTAEQRQAAGERWRRFMETSAAIEAAQPARLKAALDALSPRDPRDLNIFALGIAGSNEGDVFAKENAKALAILGERFHLAGRSLTLANTDNPDDASPAASIENIASALNGLKQRMDLDRDILVLSMTSHGSPYGFQLAGSGYDRILSPRLLNAMLKDAGIKNRIIIVSACASGVFVPALANDNTVVITAAAKDRSSFGCDSDREWTYFGDAFFAHGLKESSTLAEAFGKARRQVAIWEAEKDYTPSEPQIFVGKEIARQFPRIVGPETSASSLKRAPLRGPLRSAAR